MESVEELCQRHRPTTAEEMKSISEWTHPHVRDFNNLSVLPSFGVLKVNRTVGDTVKNLSAEVVAASSSSNNSDNDN